MKKIILLALTTLIIVGCEHKHPDGSYDSSRNAYSTIAIDSCEYIKGTFKLVHKGNCKYCAERRKQELREIIDSIKMIKQR